LQAGLRPMSVFQVSWTRSRIVDWAFDPGAGVFDLGT
jgi:hypothetical protein